MIVTHKVSIDLLRPGIEPRINAVQDDKYSRSLAIALFLGGAAWEIPQDATAVIQYRKSDGIGGTYNTLPNGGGAYTISGNVITVALAPQVLNVAGIVLLSVKLTQGSKELNTFTVIMQVHPNPGSNISSSEPYFNVPGLMPTPPYAKTGQYFRVDKTTKNGQVASVVAVDIPFCISISQNPDGSYSADKTRLEAVEAYDAGIPVFCDMPIPGAFINTPIRIPLVQNLLGYLIFETVYQTTQYRVVYFLNDAVYPNVDNVISVTATPLAKASDIPSGGNGNDSSQNGNGLTAAQIIALDNMFKVCAFIKEDVSTEYSAFQTAFGIEGGNVHTHSYTSSVTTAATCTTAGVRTYNCNCGHSYTETIPATGHNYVDGVCTVCGEKDPTYNTDVTLTSISVAYNGGDVAVGTAVADLTGIVVAAHYSDGSQQNVTGYTLSGTIAEGSNTITVSYGGKTTTFTVSGVAEPGGDDTTETPFGVEWTEGYMLLNGQPYTNTQYVVSDYIDVSGKTEIRIHYDGTGNKIINFQIESYDTDKNRLKGYARNTYLKSESDPEYPSPLVYPIQTGTAYVRMATSIKNGSDTAGYVYYTELAYELV